VPWHGYEHLMAYRQHVCVNRTSKWVRFGCIDEKGLSHGFLLKRGTRVDVKGTKGFRLFFSFIFWLIDYQPNHHPQ